jgi:hypothetical protein
MYKRVTDKNDQRTKECESNRATKVRTSLATVVK